MRTTLIVLPFALFASSACVKEAVIGGGTSTVGPSLVVEQFLRAANSEPPNLQAMGRLFGTKDGSAAEKWPRVEVEQRMFAIARELKHQDFEITGEQIVPGRVGEATRLIVRVTVRDRPYNVPFTLVRYKANTWLIEEIGISVLTRPTN
jgi:hypothetical protein